MLVQRADEFEMTQGQIIEQLRKEYEFDVGQAVEEINLRDVGQLELAK
jgi:hypothetical protein